MSKGVIYILTNPSFPQYVKIGYASDLRRRLRELNRSEALPCAFRAYATCDVDHKLTDRALHEFIDQLSPDLRTIETFNGQKRNREFFEMAPEAAYAIIDAIACISGTSGRLYRVTLTGEQIEEERETEETREASRKPPFRFSMVGLGTGDQVAFVGDFEKVATVVDERRVEYDGVTTSLSALAECLTGSRHAIQGPSTSPTTGRHSPAGAVAWRARRERPLGEPNVRGQIREREGFGAS